MATYVSKKLGLRLALGKGRARKMYYFKNGVLTLDEADTLLMDQFLIECAPAARQLINKMDFDKAVEIAKKHQESMKQIGGGAHQGPMSSMARSKQIQEVATKIAATELQSVGIDPQRGMIGAIAPMEDDPSFVRATAEAAGARATAAFKAIPAVIMPQKTLNLPGKK